MLETLRKKLGIAGEKYSVCLAETGNTVSFTIPIALALEAKAGRLNAYAMVLLSGFGVGQSWASTVPRWHPEFVLGAAQA